MIILLFHLPLLFFHVSLQNARLLFVSLEDEIMLQALML